MYTFGFEKLDVWQLSRKFVGNLYRLTSTFPDTEKFGLTSQIRRAGVSIISNIAEGNTRKNPKDQSRFTEIAFSSLSEALTQLIISKDLGYIKEDQYIALRDQLEEISNKLNSLYKIQISRTKSI
jgi:four helix bundle protein